jgi:hypothetical protein
MRMMTLSQKSGCRINYITDTNAKRVVCMSNLAVQSSTGTLIILMEWERRLKFKTNSFLMTKAEFYNKWVFNEPRNIN